MGQVTSRSHGHVGSCSIQVTVPTTAPTSPRASASRRGPLIRADFSPVRDIPLHERSHISSDAGTKYDYDCLIRALRADPPPAYIGMIGAAGGVRPRRALVDEGFSMGSSSGSTRRWPRWGAETPKRSPGRRSRARHGGSVAETDYLEGGGEHSGAIFGQRRRREVTGKTTVRSPKRSRLSRRGRRCVLATIVETKGSTPRKVGARSSSTPPWPRGYRGGGCGEAEVIESAHRSGLWVPERVRVDLTDDFSRGVRPCAGASWTCSSSRVRQPRRPTTGSERDATRPHPYQRLPNEQVFDQRSCSSETT